MRTSHSERLFPLLCILFFFSVIGLHAGGVSVYDLAAETGSVFQWDPFNRRGVLVKNAHRLSFKAGIPAIVFDYDRKASAETVTFKEGVPYFSDTSAQKIREFFAEKVTAEGQRRISTVIIDPGHGGRDSGAVASHELEGKQKLSLVEKDVVLEVSREVRGLLVGRFSEKNIIMTREDDTYPSLEDRVELANNVSLRENESIIYVSIHANASPFNKNSRGFEVWYLPSDYRRDLIDPASVEKNKQEILPILNTMLEEEFTIESVLLAKDILTGLQKTIGKESPNRGLKEQSWYVVRNAKMPSVLIELGFITNREEAQLLNDNAYLSKVAEGIYNGISEFILNFEKPADKAE